jgi:hypothetical protein
LVNVGHLPTIHAIHATEQCVAEVFRNGFVAKKPQALATLGGDDLKSRLASFAQQPA